MARQTPDQKRQSRIDALLKRQLVIQSKLTLLEEALAKTVTELKNLQTSTAQ